MVGSPRILTPAGQIVRYLITKNESTAREIATYNSIAPSTTYSNLKDLLLAGFVIRNEESFSATEAGVKAYVSEVLPGVDADGLVDRARLLNVNVLELVELGVRLVMAVAEAAYVPADLARLLTHHDPSALKRLEDIFDHQESGIPQKLKEVVA